MRTLIAVTAAVSVVLLAARFQDPPKNVEALEKRVASLEKRVEALEGRGATGDVDKLLAAAKIKMTESNLHQLQSALELYYLDKAAYPTQEQGLKVLVDGKYVTQLANDPWGNPINYRIPGKDRAFDLWSFGPDGKDGTADDIRLK